jgi:hypothetical protein
LSARVDPAALYAFYNTWLTRHGFHRVIAYRPADQVTGMAWETDGRVQVQVGVYDPIALARDAGVRATPPVGGVLYGLFFVGYSHHPSGDAGG